MCDTFVYQAQGAVWFGKNSDREPDEPQVLERHRLHRGPGTTRTTYLEVPAPEHRLAMILSRPSWMWGAEMGVNQHGVAIGNQAVFTRLVQRRGEALLGMDLLRLALEQARSSRDARDIITRYLEQFGQGGPAGYRKKRLRYDSSFIIADFHEAWVLETAGRFWAARRVRGYAAISNDLSIEEEFDLGASGMEEFARDRGWAKPGAPFNFREAFRRPFMPWAARARQRREGNLRQLALLDPSAELQESAFTPLLRQHAKAGPGSNADVCMHAGGRLRPVATNSSLIAKVSFKGLPKVWSCSGQPCENPYRPMRFARTGEAMEA
jgi:dipeptidase